VYKSPESSAKRAEYLYCFARGLYKNRSVKKTARMNQNAGITGFGKTEFMKDISKIYLALMPYIINSYISFIHRDYLAKKPVLIVKQSVSKIKIYSY